MILFLDDFRRFPSATYDVRTTNQSFVELASKLKGSGINNHGFMLTILNQDLIGVDPFDETLSLEVKVAIAAECKFNPWYYIREVLRIPPPAGIEPLRFKANRSNVMAMWLFCNHIDFILTQPRQTGKSVGADAIASWVIWFGSDNTKYSLLTKDSGLRAANIERLKEIRDLLPPYLIIPDKTDSDNKIGLSYNRKKNTYTTAVSQASESNATNAGRGITSAIFQVDEAPFISHIEAMMKAALAGGTEAKNVARATGSLYGTMITTTAGKRDSRDGKYIHGLVEESAKWREEYYDCANQEDLRETITKACRGKIELARIYACFSHTQLGKDDQWLLTALAESGSSGEDADRDFFNIWTSGSLQSPLTPDQNKTINDSIIAPRYVQRTVNNYTYNWYIPQHEVYDYMENNKLVLSSDTSEAVGRDDIALYLTNIKTLETVMSSTVNESNTTLVARSMAKLMIDYPNITLIVERKSTGLAIMDAICLELLNAGINPFKRIFNQIVQEKFERESDYKEISKEFISMHTLNKYRKYLGFNTTAASRLNLYHTVLPNSISKAGHSIRSDVLATQLLSLVVKNNRIDHQSSGHDDMVIAYLLAGWFLSQGRNMDFYGINTLDCLSATKVEVIATVEDEVSSQRRKRAKAEIESLHQQLSEAADNATIYKLEAKLAAVVSRSQDVVGELLSIDAMIVDAENNRRTLRSAGRRNRRRA